ncbi:lamin tail domain-containing protein [Cerasicoccus frondis]|uniref:lamin tail domain-containing protein n=1 Tax=Cerasicoccus frondis TaxID=490090 RepID=UPI00285287CE|nr:lamin tail domain-containing protein [Cerasicoccus frondis]
MAYQKLLCFTSILCGAWAATSSVSAQDLLLTEILSSENSAGGEDFWELTNVGVTTVDLSNWSWDDDSRVAGTAIIPDGTLIEPGESIIFTKMEAGSFRSWWGLPETVQVLTGDGAPGLGGDDGVALFNDASVEVLFFSYAAGGFVLSDGSLSLGDHAGLSAGGSSETASLIIDPTFGIEYPRYTVADGANFGTVASTIDAGDVGSPGSVDNATFADRLLVTELMSNQEFGVGEDFWELTNIGLLPIDLGGWSWDDNSREAGVVPIPTDTFIQSGESIIFTAADAAVFRTWWGIEDSVQVIGDSNAPGLGGGDGVALFDADDAEIFFFTYDEGGFTLVNGSPSLGGHAGPSSGGALDSESLVLDPTYGTTAPRYTYAKDVSALDPNDFGTPGVNGIFSSGPRYGLLLTEVLSNQDSGGGEDFWELTNVGLRLIDLGGWSWSDNGREAGEVVIPTGIQIAPGESIIFTEMDAAAFRAWWDLAESVQVISDSGAPGLGGGDGISFFDPLGNEVFFFSYDVGGFTLVDGSESLGDHAGLSAGGATKTQSLVIVPAYGVENPRYTFADGTTLGTTPSTIASTDIASPGVVTAQAPADVLVLTELLSNQEYGSGEDFWELTNIGLLPIDLSGWSWSDNGREAGEVMIPSGVYIGPGESVIFTAATPEIFRAWWGLSPLVQVISDPEAPGFGKGDGVSFFNADSDELFFFSYDTGGFIRPDGSESIGDHAGISAGGSLASESLVIDPSFGAFSPRYTYATWASALDASDFGTPGFSGLSGVGAGFDLTVVITPGTFVESASNPAASGTVTRSGDTTEDLVVELSSSDEGETTVPSTVTILAGHASASFDVTAVDDSFPDGDQTVTITASATGANPGTQDVTVADDGDALDYTLMLTEVLTSESDLAPSSAEDYWELTNFGASTVNLEGFSWHDSGRSAASAAAWALPADTFIAPNESVIFTEMDPAAFRAWWGLSDTVQVFQSVGAPGLGKGDGVSFFDPEGNEIFFFSYAGGGFLMEDGSASTAASEHAGLAGGGAETAALVWVLTSGTENPRYTAATGSNYATFQAVDPATDLGSPGNPGEIVPTVSIASASVTEGDSGTSTLSFTVTRNVTDTAFSVDYAIGGGTATAGIDYIAVSGTVTFTDGGASSQTIDVTVLGDTDSEQDETVIITLSNLVDSVGETVIGNSNGVGTILNDDPLLPSIDVQAEGTTIGSGGVGYVRIAASGTPTPTIQWFEGDAGDTSKPVDGATSATLITAALTETTKFWARVTNSAGSIDSDTVTVTVVASPTEVDLTTYVRIGRYDLPEPTRTALPDGTPVHNLLCQEASGVTYNWDTDTLFVVGDGGRSVTQVTKTGELIDTMTLALGSSAQGTEFYDLEGVTYIGGGEFVFSEERDRQLVKFTYVAGTTLERGDTQTVKLGTFVDNTGTEGMSHDPMTGGFIVLKEISPIGIFQTNVDFDAGTASNGSASTENSTNLFDPALLGMSDVADVYALSNIPSMVGQPQYGNLLIVGQEDARIVNVDRSGNIASTLNIQSDLGNPLSAGNQQHEGITMDLAGRIYIVNENGGGDSDHPQLWVFAVSEVPNEAPTAIVLDNVVTSIQENTSTAFGIKLADIVLDDDGLGDNEFTITGADAASFEISGLELFLKAGVVLDYETQTSYSIMIEVDDTLVGGTPDATVNYTLLVDDEVVELPPAPALIISEVAPWSSGDSPVGSDWFEVTNTSDSAVDITGWKVDDGSANFANAVALSGVTSIAAGESVIFIETSDLATTAATFITTWFGDSAPTGLQIGSYSGSGLGLSTNGDAVNLYDESGELQASVSFGAADGTAPYATFDNTVGLDGTTITLLSVEGWNGAFVAANDANEIGSPGEAPGGNLVVTEVAPWSSGNSPVGADWFEVTNIGARTVDITDWKMDDGSESPVAAVPLVGITSIAPGESVIFIEISTNLSDAQTAFADVWFDGSLPSGLQIGGYSGSGVGLSTGGDAVNLYDTANVRRANVSFGQSPNAAPYGTFDNSDGLDVVIVTQLSVVGVNGAFLAANDSNEIGSPGTISRSFNGAYNAWTADFPGIDLTDTAGTVNGNSMPNLMLFAFGLDPSVNNSGADLILDGTTLTQRGAQIVDIEATASGTDYEMWFVRRRDAASLGLTYIVQFSYDMSSWSSSTATPTVLAIDGEVEAVSVPYPFFTPDGRKARFARIVIIQN